MIARHFAVGFRTVAMSLIVVLLPIYAAHAATPARTTAQVEQLVAPVALHPDALLSQILMASTYPLEVVEAARWSRDNPGVTGTALEEAMQKQTWDPAVKALTAVPQVLQMMNDKLQWTQDLGDAFLAQQTDVLDAVQRLRARADASGHLNSTPQQKVAKAQPPATPEPRAPASSAPGPAPLPVVYTIESANPEEYYVPIYDPTLVYGAWPYADYVPYYWYPPGYAAGAALAFGAGVITGAAIWGHIDWWRRDVNVNVEHYNRFNRTTINDGRWAHQPAHRGNVPYRDAAVAQRFGNPNAAAAREGFRGKADAGRRDLGRAGGAAAGAAIGAGGAAAAGKAKAAAAAKGKAGAAGRDKAAGAGRDKAAAAGKSKAAAAGKAKAAAAHKAGRPTQAGAGQKARAKQAARPAAQRVSHAQRQGMANIPPGGGPRIGAGGGRGMAMHGGGGFRGGGGMRGGGGRRR